MNDEAEQIKELRRMVQDLVARVNFLEEKFRLDNGVSTTNQEGSLVDQSENPFPQPCFTTARPMPNLPASPQTSPGRSGGAFSAFPDSQSSGFGSSNDSSPPRHFNAGAITSVVDFFTIPENLDYSYDAMLPSPGMSSLMNGWSSSSGSRGNSNPYGTWNNNINVNNNNGNSNLRRPNSNRNRRCRRASLPNESPVNAWPPNSPGPINYGRASRTNSFMGIPQDTFGELGLDDAFLTSDMSTRATNPGTKELEILCRFGEIGAGPGQMNAPHGFCLGLNQEIIVADTNNHRIQFFDKHGNFLSTWGTAGKRNGQLWFPRKVAWIADSNRVVICDRGQERSRIQIFARSGIYEHAIAVDFVAIVAGMTVYKNMIVIVDSVNPTCLVIDQLGTHKFHFLCHNDMKEPSDVVVANNKFYICDFKGHCVCVYDGLGQFLQKIGDKDVINFPNGIDVTDQGQVLVGDSHGNRFHVAAYGPDGRFLAEYECPHMKVSRCCGLVLTPNGHIVTVAKNNNFILILERLDMPMQQSMPSRTLSLLEAEAEGTQETHF